MVDTFPWIGGHCIADDLHWDLLIQQTRTHVPARIKGEPGHADHDRDGQHIETLGERDCEDFAIEIWSW